MKTLVLFFFFAVQTLVAQQAPEGKPVAFGVFSHKVLFTKGFVTSEDKRAAAVAEIIEEAGRRYCNSRSTQIVDITTKSYEKDKQTHIVVSHNILGDSVTYHKNCRSVVLLCIK